MFLDPFLGLGIDMFVRVNFNLHKGFKRKCNFKRLFSFFLALVTSFFSAEWKHL